MSGYVKLRDELMATSLDWGSAIGRAVPRIGALVGQKPAASQLAARWRYARLATGEIDNLQEFPGHSASGNLPRNYKLAAMITIDKEVLEASYRKRGGHQAAVYALGTAIMVGTVEEANFLGDDPENPERYAVGMAIGKGKLLAAIGIRDDLGNTYVPPKGMHSGPVLPINEWPESVPLL